jgi:hypothetical protein
VLRLLRGEDLETLPRELGVTAATLSGWREQFLEGGAANLKAREADVDNEETQRLKSLVAGETGLKIMLRILEDEVAHRVGPPYRPDPAVGCVRWGKQSGYVVFGGQKVSLDRLRACTREGERPSFFPIVLVHSHLINEDE